MTKTVAILGGYGNAGRQVARLVLAHSGADVVLAGRDGTRAEAAARELDPARARGRAVDARDEASVRALLEGVDVLVVAASVTEALGPVADAAIAAKVDVLDVLLSSPRKHAALRSRQDAFRSAGVTWLTDGGFHPGLPALLVRRAAEALDTVRAAHVGSVIAIDWRPLSFSAATRDELVVELADFDTRELRGGRWVKAGFAARAFDFPAPFGRRDGYTMYLEELAALPSLVPGLEETGFCVGGFNALTDTLVLPAAWMLVKASRRLFAPAASRMLLWSLRAGSRPPFGTLLKLEAEGTRAGQPARFTCLVGPTDGYVLTGAPAACGVLQLLDGTARRPGLGFQALALDPARTLRDLRAMGIGVTES